MGMDSCFNLERCFQKCWAYLEKQINDKTLALHILQPFIAFMNHRAHIDRRLAPHCEYVTYIWRTPTSRL